MSKKVKNLLIAMVNVILFLTLFIGLVHVTNSGVVSYQSVNEYATSDVAYANGNVAHFDSKDFGWVNRGDIVTIHLNLPEQPMFENATLVFYDFNAVTEVWFNGALLGSYGAEIAEKGMMIGNHDFLIDVPDEAWGGEITIVLRATENNAFSNFTNIKIYPTLETYRYYIDSDPLGFLVANALFLFGALGVIAYAFVMVKNRTIKNGVYIMLAALLVSLWMISNKGLYTFFGFQGYFWQPMEYMAGYTVAIPLLMFYRSLTEKGTRWRRLFNLAVMLSLAIFIEATILNFTNILHFDSTMNVSSTMLLFNAALLCVYTICFKTDKGNGSVQLRTGMIAFIAACVYEVVIRDIYRLIPLPFLHNLPSFIAIGVLIMFICLGAFYFTRISEKQKMLLKTQIRVDTLDRMIASTPAGLCQIGMGDDLPIVAANSLFYEIIGLSKENKLKGKNNALTAVTESARDRLLPIRDELLKGGTPTNSMEVSFPNEQGDMRTILAHYHYDRENTGCTMINVVDITERKRMEEALRIGEERYKLALSQNGRAFFSLDVPGKTMHISEEQSKALDMPVKVDNVPENPLIMDMIEPQSRTDCRIFCEKIYAGEPNGSVIISCHLRQQPKKLLWYRVMFTSVFDREGIPSAAIVTYENLNEEREREIRGAWRQLDIVSIDESRYKIDEYDMTQDRLISQTGGLFPSLPEGTYRYNEVNSYALENFVHPDDKEVCNRFSDRRRILDMFEKGKFEDRCEYRTRQNDLTYRWTMLYIQLVKDPYSNDVMAQLLFKDIDDEKTGIVRMEKKVDELRKELEQSRIKVMINQMQPHFLYNALSAIQTIVKRDPDYAYQLIYDFTIHLRASIKALQSDVPIPFSEEMKNVKAYLNIEKMRMGDRLNINYDIACDDFMVIPLAIQPLTENATRHGIFPMGAKGGTLNVSSSENSEFYFIEVSDDGAGFSVESALNNDNGSVGLKNTIFRLKTLMNADVNIFSEIGKGTRVTVTIPKEGKNIT